MTGWKWNHHLHMMVPANTGFDITPEVKVIESHASTTVDLSIVDRLRELEYLTLSNSGEIAVG